jgi:(p)ppGpp synthase/HD superfamily hydrolase
MSISKSELVEMNDLLAKGKKITDLAKRYPQYDYWEIYWQVNDYSFLGKKRTITNRLKRLVTEKTTEQRRQTADEAQELINELYDQLKRNSAKLIEIDRVLRAK